MERSVRFGDQRSCETEGRLPRFERPTATRDREPDLSHRLIAMLANEVHTLRKENAKLRARAKKRHKEEHRDTVDEQVAHRGRADDVAAATAGGFQRFLTEPLGSPLAQPRTRREWPDDALRHMPFLRHYRFRPEEQLLVGTTSCSLSRSMINAQGWHVWRYDDDVCRDWQASADGGSHA
jgi:hypothetical protein